MDITSLYISSRNWCKCLVCFVNGGNLFWHLDFFFPFSLRWFSIYLILVFDFWILVFWLFSHFFLSLSLLFSFVSAISPALIEKKPVGSNFSPQNMTLHVNSRRFLTNIKQHQKTKPWFPRFKRFDRFTLIGWRCSRSTSRASAPSASTGRSGQPRSGQSFLVIALIVYLVKPRRKRKTPT